MTRAAERELRHYMDPFDKWGFYLAAEKLHSQRKITYGELAGLSRVPVEVIRMRLRDIRPPRV